MPRFATHIPKSSPQPATRMGIHNTVDQFTPHAQIDPATERDVIRTSLDRIEKATGTRPVGWMGPGMHETWNTLNTVDEGLLYCADWINDDQPYMMNISREEDRVHALRRTPARQRRY